METISVVDHYNCDEVGNVTRHSSVGGGPDLLVSGTITSAAALIGNGLSLPAGFSSNALTASGMGSLAALRSLSMSFWIKHIDTNNFGLPELKISSDGGSNFIKIVPGGGLSPGSAGCNDGVAEGAVANSSAGAPPTGQWMYMVVTWDNAAHHLVLWQNGEIIGESGENNYAVVSDWTDCAFTLNFPHTYLIDLLTFDNVALDETEILRRYNSGAGLDPTPSATVPVAPTIGTATALTATTGSLTFTPGADGGATITGFVVTGSVNGVVGTGPSSPISLSGLTTGAAQTFTVHATNSVGNSPESPASNSITPAAAGQGNQSSLLLGV